MPKTIHLGCDHAALDMKKALIKVLEAGYALEDHGTYTSESCDYPDIAHAVCRAVEQDPDSCGILICGTGIGMSIAANRHRGIRAALCGDTESATLTRQHNNANILCLGARILPFEKVIQITDTFLDASFLGGRHQKRIDMLDNLDSGPSSMHKS